MKRRVLMTADAVGGVWTYAIELARALAAHDLATTLVTMGPRPGDAQRAQTAGLAGFELVTTDFPLEWMDRPWEGLVDAGRFLLDLESSVRPSIVHLNGYALGALPWRNPVVVAAHSCLLSWQSATAGGLDDRHVECYRRAVRRGVRSADWVVAPSGAMLRAVQRWYGPVPAASVVYNGVDPGAFQPGEREPFIISGGRVWDPAKNVEAVVRVAPRLSWPVRIAGDGGTGDLALGKLAPADVRRWLARAAIFALPARYEPFGLLPLEAALSGCALILGDIDSLREIWGDAALFVDPGDDAALYHAIEALIAMPDQRAELAERAMQRARRYTADRMGRAYIRLYEQLARQVLACAS